MALPKAYLRTYVKCDGWLYKRLCKSCATDAKESRDGDVKVMDVSSLLSLKTKKGGVGWYCNCGPVGHKMVEGHEYKRVYTCDMVLCPPCFSKRIEKRDTGKGRSLRQRMG